MLAKMPQDAKLLMNLFMPFFLISSARHVYLTYGSLLQYHKFSYEAIGWILGIYFLAAMASRPLGGWMLEKFGIRRTLILSGMFSFIGCSLLFFRESMALLLIGRIISGAGFGVYSTGIFSYQALCVPQKTRGSMLSLLTVGGMLPIATVTPLGEWLLLGSQSTLYLAIGPALSLLCCFWGSRAGTATTEETHGGEKPWGTYSELFSSRSFLFLLFTGTLISLINAININISLLAVENGLMASHFLMANAAAAVLIRLAGLSLLNTLPRVALLAPCGVLMACSVVLVSLFPTSGIFVIGGILFGIGIGTGFPMLHALTADILDPALRPKGASAVLLFYDGGFFLTPLIVGYFLPLLGTSETFTMIAVAAGCALVLLEIFYWLPLYVKTK